MTPSQTMVRMSRMARLALGAPLVLSKHYWIWPLLGAAVISLVGLWTRSLIEETVRVELATRLQTLLNADVAALRLWFVEKETDARSFAADVHIRRALEQVLANLGDPALAGEMLAASEAAKGLELHLRPLLAVQKYLDYVVVTPDRRVLLSGDRGLNGKPVAPEFEPFLRRALGGQATVSRPFFWKNPGTGQTEGPTIFAAAPVLQDTNQVVAVLALRMDALDDFSRILSFAQMGQTGDAYAFDSRGVMLTASRFEDELKQEGLLPNRPDATTMLQLQLLDPGVDLSHGELPLQPRSEMPLTRMAAAATTEWSGHDVEGYRNYRGARVVGAWAWLPDYALGVATEVDTEEAFQTLNILRRVFFSLFLLLILSGIATFAFSLLVERLQASVRKGALAARRIGQYVLVQEIGRGANGMVYRARHTFLRRPVAVKLLSPDLTNEATAARFEHEVQMTSQLTHPNTVAVYDYGRTPEGLFYYAMEFLSGINLDRLVRQFGPQPEGRIIHILRQVCGSLAEAHQVGLIHRDIKPANIVLTRRGGLSDVVKVLDFGLVQATGRGAKGLTSKAVVGTPHFMSPEAVRAPEKVDARSDIYSLGGVGYWLLTGQTLFDSEDVEVLLKQQATEAPTAPSEKCGFRVSPDLEQLLMRCLDKDPERRPASAHTLEELLAACDAAGAWGSNEAEEWWRTNVAEPAPVVDPGAAGKTLVIQPRI